MPPASCPQGHVCGSVGLRHSFIPPLSPGVAYHLASLGNDCLKYIWTKSSYVPKSDLGRLVGDMHVRHSLPPFMSIGLFQEKSKEGVEWWYIYISGETLGIYIFVTLTLENKLPPLEIPQICAAPLGNASFRNGDEVVWNLAISEANLCAGSTKHSFYKTFLKT